MLSILLRALKGRQNINLNKLEHSNCPFISTHEMTGREGSSSANYLHTESPKFSHNASRSFFPSTINSTKPVSQLFVVCPQNTCPKTKAFDSPRICYILHNLQYRVECQTAIPIKQCTKHCNVFAEAVLMIFTIHKPKTRFPSENKNNCSNLK